MSPSLLLAAAGNVCYDGTGNEIPCIMDTALWSNVVQPVAAAVAVLAVLFGLFSMVKNFLGAKPGGVAKSLVLTVIGAAFLMNLEWIAELINIGDTVFSYVIDSVTTLIS